MNPLHDQPTKMKSIICKFTIAAMALAGIGAVVPEAKAANLTLDGTGYFEVANRVKYYAKFKAPKQSGRYYNLGADYYHKAEIGMDYLTNNSAKKSGDLSFEFWAMPYYGATSGVILMTEGLSPIKGRRSFTNLNAAGYAIDLDRRRFPELNIWEFNGRKWNFRDALTFDYKTWL